MCIYDIHWEPLKMSKYYQNMYVYRDTGYVFLGTVLEWLQWVTTEKVF